MTTPKRYTTKELARLSGCTLRQAQHWDETGVICPAHVGHYRLYTGEQVLLASIIVNLRAQGLNFPAVRMVIDQLQNDLRERLASAAYLAVDPDGDVVALMESPAAVLEAVTQAQRPVRVVALPGLRAA